MNLTTSEEIVANKADLNFHCTQCEFENSCKYSSALKRRKRNAQEEKSYFQCYLCHFGTSREGSLKAHISIIHRERNRKTNFGCINCLFTTSEENELKKHTICCGLENVNFLHNCYLCQYSSNNKWTLMQHINIIHKKIKSFQCNLCNFSSVYNHTLKNHKYYVHQIVDSRYICPICSNFFFYSQKLRRHIQLVHV